MLNKTIEETKEHWEIAAGAKNYRNYIAQGLLEEKTFRNSGKDSVKKLKGKLSNNKISLEGKRILEIGCGAGRMTEFLAKEADFVYAIDISEEMLRKFKKRLGRIDNVKKIRSGNLSQIPDESVDLILSDLVFQHNSEPIVEDFFRDGWRILIHGGYYVFQMTFSKVHQIIKNTYMRAVDMVRWTSNEMEKLIKECGYEIISLEGHYKILRKPKCLVHHA